MATVGGRGHHRHLTLPPEPVRCQPTEAVPIRFRRIPDKATKWCLVISPLFVVRLTVPWRWTSRAQKCCNLGKVVDDELNSIDGQRAALTTSSDSLTSRFDLTEFGYQPPFVKRGQPDSLSFHVLAANFVKPQKLQKNFPDPLDKLGFRGSIATHKCHRSVRQRL